ncbi:MAG: hypothetical protein DRI44_07315 [Chlamydiae bacterium]|nr:MAG: hypothetical protein DRI44_07315 [Chlamydiota bacterium]
MSKKYLYLSMLPESLIMSMLSPVEFGQYLSVGTSKRTHSQAIYFDIKDGFENEYFDLASAAGQCVPRADGEIKHSVYVSIYRVLEHIPVEMINNLYITTRDGRVLKLKQGIMPIVFEGKYHLYDEITPVSPLIVSTLNPLDFCNFITNRSNRMHVPKIFFTHIKLPEWAGHPHEVDSAELYSPKIEHIRDCLVDMIDKKKETKTVDRTHSLSNIINWPKNGFYVGDQKGMLYFPFPSTEELRRDHYDWWKSASM